jgi:hypothetical protein
LVVPFATQRHAASPRHVQRLLRCYTGRIWRCVSSFGITCLHTGQRQKCSCAEDSHVCSSMLAAQPAGRRTPRCRRQRAASACRHGSAASSCTAGSAPYGCVHQAHATGAEERAERPRAAARPARRQRVRRVEQLGACAAFLQHNQRSVCIRLLTTTTTHVCSVLCSATTCDDAQRRYRYSIAPPSAARTARSAGSHAGTGKACDTTRCAPVRRGRDASSCTHRAATVRCRVRSRTPRTHQPAHTQAHHGRERGDAFWQQK